MILSTKNLIFSILQIKKPQTWFQIYETKFLRHSRKNQFFDLWVQKKYFFYNFFEIYNFLWFLGMRETDSLGSISILGEVGSISNGFFENPLFSEISIIFNFSWFSGKRKTDSLGSISILGEVGNKSKSFFEKFIFFKKYKISSFTHLWLTWDLNIENRLS